MAFEQVASIGDIEPGATKVVTVQGREVVLARVGDGYFAVDNRCPHMGGHLGRGTLEGTVITCPLHGSQFDVTDGRALRWTSLGGFAAKLARLIRPPRSVRTYGVKMEDQRIMVEVHTE